MNRATTNLRALALSSVLLAITLAGCRTTRSAATKADKAVVEALSEAEYVQQVGRLSTPDYRTLTATMYVELNPDTKDEMSSRARLKIIRSRCLQISITPLAGIELFRLEVSRDSVKKHCNFRDKYELNFPLLSDEEETVCNLYGVMKEKSMYGKKYMGIERSTFIIDEAGEFTPTTLRKTRINTGL